MASNLKINVINIYPYNDSQAHKNRSGTNFQNVLYIRYTSDKGQYYQLTDSVIVSNLQRIFSDTDEILGLRGDRCEDCCLLYQPLKLLRFCGFICRWSDAFTVNPVYLSFIQKVTILEFIWLCRGLYFWCVCGLSRAVESLVGSHGHN
jgi:hypothetical protein